LEFQQRNSTRRFFTASIIGEEGEDVTALIAENQHLKRKRLNLKMKMLLLHLKLKRRKSSTSLFTS
jgi:hypothetical protein